MSAFTIRYREMPGDAERAALDGSARRSGGRTSWSAGVRLGRAYALVENAGVEALRSASSGTILESAVIALAVWPNVAEALPYLQDALGGNGRPAGIVSCEIVDEALLVEWNLDRTGADVVLGLIDVELRRFGSGRASELLSPLPLAWWTRLAAEGLRAPQIAPDRVLEALLETVDAAD